MESGGAASGEAAEAVRGVDNFSDSEELDAFIVGDAAPRRIAEPVGRVQYVFDEEERAVKLKAVICGYGPTDPPDLHRAKHDAVEKEISSVRPGSSLVCEAGRAPSASAPAAADVVIPPRRDLLLQHDRRYYPLLPGCPRSEMRLQDPVTAPNKTGLWPRIPRSICLLYRIMYGFLVILCSVDRKEQGGVLSLQLLSLLDELKFIVRSGVPLSWSHPTVGGA